MVCNPHPMMTLYALLMKTLGSPAANVLWSPVSRYISLLTYTHDRHAMMKAVSTHVTILKILAVNKWTVSRCSYALR